MVEINTGLDFLRFTGNLSEFLHFSSEHNCSPHSKMFAGPYDVLGEQLKKYRDETFDDNPEYNKDDYYLVICEVNFIEVFDETMPYGLRLICIVRHSWVTKDIWEMFRYKSESPYINVDKYLTEALEKGKSFMNEFFVENPVFTTTQARRAGIDKKFIKQSKNIVDLGTFPVYQDKSGEIQVIDPSIFVNGVTPKNGIRMEHLYTYDPELAILAKRVNKLSKKSNTDEEEAKELAQKVEKKLQNLGQKGVSNNG
jgi:hypothetical protein